MKFRFTIGKKIASGFGILIILTLIVFTTTYIILEQSRTTNNRISSVNTPSVKALQELKYDMLESKLFLESWMRIEKAHADKDRLLKFRNKEYPKIKSELTALSSYWPEDQRDSLSKLFD